MSETTPAKRNLPRAAWIIIALVAALTFILARSLIIAALVSVGRGIYAILIGPSQILYWMLLLMAGIFMALLSFQSSEPAVARQSAEVKKSLHEGRVAQISRRLRVASRGGTTHRDFALYLLKLISDAKGLPHTESHRLLQDRFERGDFALPPQVQVYLAEALNEPDEPELSTTIMDVPPLVWIRAWIPHRLVPYRHDPRLDDLIEFLEAELDISYASHPE